MKTVDPTQALIIEVDDPLPETDYVGVLSRAANGFFSDDIKFLFRDCGSDIDIPGADRKIEMMVEFRGWRGSIMIEKEFLKYDTDGRYLRSRFELVVHHLAKSVFTRNK